MKSVTPILFLLISVVSLSKITFWKRLSTEDHRTLIDQIQKEVIDSGLNQKQELHLAHVCLQLRTQVINPLNNLSKLYEKNRDDEILGRVKNFFWGRDISELTQNYMFVVNSINSFLTNQGVVSLSPKLPPLQYVKTSLVDAESPRLIDQMFDKDPSDEWQRNAAKLTRFEPFPLGQFMAAMLFHESFGCLTVPELSLLIFQLFYFKMVKEVHAENFFMGLLSPVITKDGSTEETVNDQTKRMLLQRFIKYNFQIFMGVQSDLMRLALRLFDKELQKSRSSYINNFIKMYRYSLEVIELAEGAQDNSDKNFMDRLANFDPDVWKKFGTRVGIFGLIQALQFGQGITTKGLSTVTQKVAEGVVEHLAGTLDEQLKAELLPEDKPLEKTFDLALLNGKQTLMLKNLDHFLKFFEDRVNAYESCEMCLLLEEEEMTLIKKLAKKEGKAD